MRKEKVILDKPQLEYQHHFGEQWRGCVMCGGSYSEADDDTGQTNFYGRLYPESLMVERDGKYYCTKHYNWRFIKRDSDVRIEIAESDERELPEKGTIDKT